MRLLMFYTGEWWYRTAEKSLDEAPEVEKEESVHGAVVIFYHAEQKDEENPGGTARKFLKNVKWIAGKFSTRKVVLHSFNHLSQSKSSSRYALSLLREVEGRLRNSGYEVMVTPFGYFNEFRMHVAGDSLAKVFKEF